MNTKAYRKWTLWIAAAWASGLIILTLAGSPALAAGPNKPLKRIALVLDGPEIEARGMVQNYKKELHQLLDQEYRLLFPVALIRQADFTIAGVRSVLASVLARKDVDLVICLGPISSREACLLDRRARPVIAPFIIDHVFQQIPYSNGVSGKKNLSYVEMPDIFNEDMRAFRQIYPFKNLAIVGGKSLFAALPGGSRGYDFRSALKDARIHVVAAGENVDQTLANIPANADAVYFIPIPEMALETQKQLLQSLALKRLPVFALLGHDHVRMGALAGLTSTDWFTRIARRVALNARKILAGQPAGRLPVSISRQSQLMINMQTARISGVYPSFTVLSEAIVINREPEETTRKLTLKVVMDEAVLVNLDLAARGRSNAAGEATVDQVRAQLFPQLSARATGTVIDEDRAENAAYPAEQTVTGSVSLSQVIWSDSAWSNLSVEKMRQLGRTLEWEQSRMDVALDAANAYLNVLLARTQMEILRANIRLTRSNLENANIRKSLGAATAAEVYRLESQISQERADVIQAEAQHQVARIELNRVLAYPLEQSFQLDDVGLTETLSDLISPQVIAYVDNDRTWGHLRQFLVDQGLVASPELMKIDADIAVQKRQLKSAKRAFYSPSVNLTGELSHLMDESGTGADISSADGPDDTDWSVSLNMSIPLWEGGARIADYSAARETIKSLNLQRRSTLQRVEQRIRSAAHTSGAAYAAIDLSRTGAEASRKNLDLVADSYSRGTVPLIDLLDAQNTHLQAEQSAANAVYNFLLELMELERAIGRFTFFATKEQRQGWLNTLTTYIENKEK